jgi:hypothetical protein
MKRAALLLTAIIGTIEAHGQALPAPIFLQVPTIVQQTPRWDWVALAQQLIAVKMAPNPPPAQCALVEYAYGANTGACCATYNSSCEVGGNMAQVAWLIGNSGANVSQFSLPTTPADIYNTLKSGRPIILLLKDVPVLNSYHYVLIRGMHFEAKDGSVAAILHVNDPWTAYVWKFPFLSVLQNAVDAIVVGP